MERLVLVTAGNGMFGQALICALLGDERVKVRAMVRDREKFKLEAPNLEVVVADMDAPAPTCGGPGEKGSPARVRGRLPRATRRAP